MKGPAHFPWFCPLWFFLLPRLCQLFMNPINSWSPTSGNKIPSSPAAMLVRVMTIAKIWLTRCVDSSERDLPDSILKTVKKKLKICRVYLHQKEKNSDSQNSFYCDLNAPCSLKIRLISSTSINLFVSSCQKNKHLHWPYVKWVR